MHTGCIDEDYLRTWALSRLRNMEDSLDAVPRRLRLRTDNRQALADQRIQQRRLARVRAPQDADETGMEGHRDVRERVARDYRDPRLAPRERARTRGTILFRLLEDYISFIWRGSMAAMRTRSTRRSVESRTSNRRPSPSMTSPFCGMRPASSVTRPAMVVASLPSMRTPNNSSR